MNTPPNSEPTRIVAGDTARWIKALPHHPASDGWVLTYTLVSLGQTLVITTSAGEGGAHAIHVAATTTANWPAGRYDWRAQVRRGDDAYTVAAGQIQIAPAFGAGGLDARTEARKALDSVEAVLHGRASSAVAEYQIAGRQLRYIPVPELLALRDRLRADVAREDAAQAIANGNPPPGRIYVRFGR